MKPHPLERFQYCPCCGSAQFENNDFKSRRCKQCGFTFYLNSAAAVVGVITNRKGELLVARRAMNPARGTLDLPGGFVDFGESLEQAVHRELCEETGCSVHIVRWLFSLPNTYRYSDFDIYTVDSFFLCTLPAETELRASDDVSELFWMPVAQLDASQFGMNSVRNSIPLLQQHLSSEPKF